MFATRAWAQSSVLSSLNGSNNVILQNLGLAGIWQLLVAVGSTPGTIENFAA